MTPKEFRQMIRTQAHTGPTAGFCPGYAQANLVVLPRDLAYDFLLFAQRNPKSCPLLEVTDTGSRFLSEIAKGADIATDLPKYRVYEHGVMTGEYTDVSHLWRDDLVSFLIGCSFSFEGELLETGVPVRHIEQNCNVPMYLTNIPCTPAGVFRGNMVVSMRPMPYDQIVKSVLVTGDPSVIGIKDVNQPDFGDAVTINPGEVPVFWPCGVTPQAALMASKPAFAITHAPGHMLVTDVKNIDLKY